MVTKIQKWGNSQGLRLSREILRDARLEVGETVHVAVRDGAIVLTPTRRMRGGHDLLDLVNRIPPGSEAEELDWGPPEGREVW